MAERRNFTEAGKPVLLTTGQVERERGYSFQVDHIEYAATKDGRPLTLLDCWRAVYGVGHARIWSPTGRLVLDDAGALSARWAHCSRARRR